MTTKKLTLIAMALTILPVLGVSGEPLKFHNDYDAAAKQSAETGKPVITIFSASWCGPCLEMKRSVYPSQQVTPFHDQFVWAYLDADQAKNKGLMQHLGVQGIPHISFISPDRRVIDTKVGAASPEQFAFTLSEILKKNSALVQN